MSSEQPSTARRRKHRSSVACDFCRRRKLGCDNSKPKCESCRLRGVDCTYAKRAKTARPSNSRINRLEEENARLRSSLRRQSSQQPDIQDAAAEPITHSTIPDVGPNETSFSLQDTTSPQNIDEVSQSSFIRPQDPFLPSPTTPLQRGATSVPQQDIGFHGPASVMFDATPRKEKDPSSNLSTSHAKNQLLADATRQRQLEVVNLHNGKLDFDGVDPGLGLRLLAFFWNRQHYSGTIVYRPVFMRDMACQGPYFSKLLLNAIYFGASKSLSASDNPNHDNGKSFRLKFEEHLHESRSMALWKSDITTIQALLIVSDSLFTWCDERSLAWQYMGIAISMIIDLGIHVEGTSSRSTRNRNPEDLEVHRRLFWSSFILDKVQSIYQGRPARLREMDNRVTVEFLDEYEELELFSTLTYSSTPRTLDQPAYSVSTFRELCQLSIIMDRILCGLYAEKSASRDPLELFHVSRILQNELGAWRDNLPGHISINLDKPESAAPLPHTLSLLSMYNSLVILLNRPFVSDGHLQSASASAASDAFALCAKSALEIHNILLMYQKHFCMTTTPYFVSYATYVSATIHVRIAAQQRPDSEAHKRLENCLYALAEQQVNCYGPRQTLRILKGLMHRLNVHVKKMPKPLLGGCQGEQIPNVSRGLDVAIGVDPQTHADVPQNLSEAQTIMSGPIFTDWDIEEVMRSFDYGFRCPLTSAYTEGNTSQPTQSSTAAGMDGVNAEGSMGNLAPSLEDTISYGLEEMLFLDPLFGFDGSSH